MVKKKDEDKDIQYIYLRKNYSFIFFYVPHPIAKVQRKQNAKP